MRNPAEAPPVRWLAGNAAQRRLAWDYFISDVFWGLFYRAGHQVLRATSIDACSWIGGAFGHLLRHYVSFRVGDMHRYRKHEAQARAAWTWLRPGDDQRAIAAAMDRAFKNSGRSYCEFSVLHRLWAAGRIEVQGAEHLAAARADNRPTLVAGLHLGNWETVGPALIGLGYGTQLIYQVPPNRFDHQIAIKARQRYGCRLVPPGRNGARHAWRALAEARDVLLMYMDEHVNGRVYAPFFGRGVTLDGNLAKAARLAALTQATVIPAYSERLQGARFRVNFLPPVALSHGGDRDADLRANVAALNAVIEPIVHAHLDQWLWLFDILPEHVAAKTWAD